MVEDKQPLPKQVAVCVKVMVTVCVTKAGVQRLSAAHNADKTSIESKKMFNILRVSCMLRKDSGKIRSE